MKINAVLFSKDSRQRNFILSFSFISFSLFLFMYLNQQNMISRPVNTFTAHSVKVLADNLGFCSNVEQVTYIRERGNDRINVPTTLLTIGNFKARIILECSAVHASILLLAFILSYPSPALQKMRGIIFLTPVLIIFNTARIFILMLLGHYLGADSSIYNILHIYVMRFLMIFIVLLLALTWLRWVDLRKYDPPIWFLFKFLLISGGFFTAWFFLKETIELKPGFLINSTYPLLVFVSLVLASSKLNIKKDCKEILVGTGIMILFLIFLQMIYFSYLYFHSAGSELIFVLVHSAFIYILPFGLFFLLIRKKLLMMTDAFGRRIFVCPICGKSGIKNLKAHAQAKHSVELRRGDDMLKQMIRASDSL